MAVLQAKIRYHPQHCWQDICCTLSLTTAKRSVLAKNGKDYRQRGQIKISESSRAAVSAITSQTKRSAFPKPIVSTVQKRPLNMPPADIRVPVGLCSLLALYTIHILAVEQTAGGANTCEDASPTCSLQRNERGLLIPSRGNHLRYLNSERSPKWVKLFCLQGERDHLP